MAYTTLSLIQAELQSAAITASTTPSSSQVETWISETDRIIDVMTGYTFSSTIVSSQYMDYDGSGILRLVYVPVLEVSTLEYNKNSNNNSTTDWVTLEEGFGKNYLTYLDEGEIEFISGDSATNKITPQSGSKRFRVTYSYGYSTIPLEIQRLSTLMTCKRVINSLLNSQANTEGGEVTVGPISVKDPTSFGISQIKSMNEEIEQLKNQIGQSFKHYRIGRVY